MSDMEEYPFGFMNTPSCLLVLASTEIALTLWRYKFKYAASNYSYESVSSLLEQNFSCEEIYLLVAPSRIKAVIDGRIAAVRVELKNFIYRYLCVRNADFQEVFSMCFKHMMVVDYSGSICSKATAINIANSDEFSECSENETPCEIHRLNDLVGRFSPMLVNDDVSDLERTISRVISFLQSGQYQSAVHLLPKLNRVQAEKVFEEAAPRILRILVLNNAYFLNLREFWIDMKHVVLKDESIFCGVLHELWRLVFDPVWDESFWTKYLGDQVNDFLLEIWSSAPDKLKAAVSNQCISKFFSRLSDDPCRLDRFHCRDMTFALDMLKRSQNVNKAQAWRTYWRALALRAKPSYLEEFIKLCLPNDEAVEPFKNKLADFNALFKWLIEEGFYSDLKDYVMLCSKDTIQRQLLGKKVLESNLDVIFLQDDEKFAKFEWFVSEVFVNVRKDIDEFKSQMISSAKFVKNLLASPRADKIRSNDFSRIIRRFVNDEVELQRVKRQLFEHCCTYEGPSHPKCNADQWLEFLVWCTADLEEISTFKRSLNVDVIFLEHLKSYYLYHNDYYVEVLDFLDGFLKWYFGNEEDAKNFKLEKVKNYKQIDILRVVMGNQFIYTNDEMYTLLKWLFDGNLEKVVEFCKSCKVKWVKKSWW